MNGNQISAGFIYNGYWHLLGGRLICQMNVIKDRWTHFCDIQDISEWIDCKKVTQEKKETEEIVIKSLFYELVAFEILVIIGIGLMVSIIFIKLFYEKKGEKIPYTGTTIETTTTTTTEFVPFT